MCCHVFTWEILKGKLFRCWFSQWTKLKLYPFGLTRLKTRRHLRRSSSKWPLIGHLIQNATSTGQICPAKEPTLGSETFFLRAWTEPHQNQWNLSKSPSYKIARVRWVWPFGREHLTRPLRCAEDTLVPTPHPPLTNLLLQISNNWFPQRPETIRAWIGYMQILPVAIKTEVCLFFHSLWEFC